MSLVCQASRFRAGAAVADAGSFLALFVAQIFLLVAVIVTVLAPVILHAGRKFDVVVFGIFLRDGAKFLMVVRELHGLHFLGVDARPDDVVMFAAVLDVNDDGAGLAGKAELVFGAPDEIVIVLAVEGALRVVGIEGQRIEILDALRRLGLGIPFGKGAVQVLRDGAAHVDDFNAVLSYALSRWVASCCPPAR